MKDVASRWGPSLDLRESPWERETKRKQTEERQKAKEAFSFDTWKTNLEAAKSYQAFLQIFDNVLDLENPDLREYIFGENGILHQIAEGKIDLSEDEDDTGRFSSYNEYSDTFIGYFYEVLGKKILDEEKYGRLDTNILVAFVKHLPQTYEEKFDIRNENEETFLKGAKIYGTEENWEAFRRDQEANLGNDLWENMETPSSDPYDRWDIQDFNRENGLYLAKDFFNVCAEKKLFETVPALFEIACYVPVGSLNTDIAEAFNKIGSHEAAEFLLSKVTDKKTPIREKNVASRLLYLLEMGKISVSEGMVEYLSKKYNLQGEKRGEVVHAIRITSDGKLGLFDKNKKLIAYAEFGNFEDQTETEAQMMEISTELLLSRQDLSPEEQSAVEKDKESFLQDYHKVFFENFIAVETSVRVNNLSLREQFWFYRFLKHHEDEETRSKVVVAAKKIGESFIKTFIGLQFDPDASQKIFIIAERYSQRDAVLIFERYATLIDVRHHLDEELSQFFKNSSDTKKIDQGELTEVFLQRAANILTDYSENNKTEQELSQSLREVGTDMITFAAIFKVVLKQGDVSFEDIQGMDFESRDISHLTGDEKNRMIDILTFNWVTSKTTEQEKKTGEKVGEDFKKHLESGVKSNFYLLKKDGKIISFIRFDEIPDRPGHKYARSFNVDSTLQNASIGSAMMEKTLMRESEYSVLEATFNPRLDVGMRYIESVGFRITNTLPNYMGSGETFFEIVCDKNIRSNLGSRQESSEDILRKNEYPHFTFTKENMSVAIRKVEEMHALGYNVSRYFVHPKDPRQRVMVFEKILSQVQAVQLAQPEEPRVQNEQVA